MTSNNIAAKTNARLGRIQNTTKAIRLILQYGLPLLVLIPMLVLVLLPTYGITAPREFFLKWLHDVSAVGKSDPVASSPVAPGMWLNIVNLVLFGFVIRTVFALLRSFEKGKLFTKDTVRCIKILGCLAFASGAVETIYGVIIHTTIAAALMTGLSTLLFGFLIFYLAWIMDEGRKIQEEQELTA